MAERAGLRPGDTILEVNGTPFRAVTHEEALKVSPTSAQLSRPAPLPPSASPQRRPQSSNSVGTISLHFTSLDLGSTSRKDTNEEKYSAARARKTRDTRISPLLFLALC